RASWTPHRRRRGFIAPFACHEDTKTTKTRSRGSKAKAVRSRSPRLCARSRGPRLTIGEGWQAAALEKPSVRRHERQIVDQCRGGHESVDGIGVREPQRLAPKGDLVVDGSLVHR